MEALKILQIFISLLSLGERGDSLSWHLSNSIYSYSLYLPDDRFFFVSRQPVGEPIQRELQDRCGGGPSWPPHSFHGVEESSRGKGEKKKVEQFTLINLCVNFLRVLV